MKIFIVTLTEEQKEDIDLDNFLYKGKMLTSFCSFVITDDNNDMLEDAREDNILIQKIKSLLKTYNESIVMDCASESTFSLWIPVDLYNKSLDTDFLNILIQHNISAEKNTLFKEYFE